MKNTKEDQRSKKKKEVQSLRKSLDELYKEKEVLGANYDKARADMNREVRLFSIHCSADLSGIENIKALWNILWSLKHDEMKRIQSELLYKDKKEYEDMIR